MHTRWKIVQKWLSGLMRWQGPNGFIDGDTAVLPGMDGLASLLYITKHNKSGCQNFLVVDATRILYPRPRANM